jgi:hypothetical protein
MKPDQAQAILQLLADVLVEHDYAASVVCIAQGMVDDPDGGEPRQSVVMAKAPAELELQLGVAGQTTTAVIGQSNAENLLDALRAVLASYAEPPE